MYLRREKYQKAGENFNTGLHVLYSSLNVIRINRSLRIRWLGRGTYVHELARTEMHTKFYLENLKANTLALSLLGLTGRII
jgi:hypothetical protein